MAEPLRLGEEGRGSCSTGVTQRMVLSPHSAAAAPSAASGFGHGAFPCFHAVPKSQPVLPCLLRRLLQKGKGDAAVRLLAASPHPWGSAPLGLGTPPRPQG